MSGYIDLHSHWVAGIDDGAADTDAGVSLVRALSQAGFSQLIATPHMRTGMFDNTQSDIRNAYQLMLTALQCALPDVQTGVGCEHYLDDIVFERIIADQAVPYPGNHGILLEFSGNYVPAMLHNRLFAIRRKSLRPVIAHPERYHAWLQHPGLFDELVDQGVVLMLDAGSLAGQFGSAVQYAAEVMLDAGLFYCACSDAHTLDDVDACVEGIERMKQLIGRDETNFLLQQGPDNLLRGTVQL